MEQYISKSAVVAEIEKRMLRYEQERKTEPAYYDGLYTALEDLRDDFINTIEVKEVNLDESARHYLLHEHTFPLNEVLHQADLKVEIQYHKDIEDAYKSGFELGIKAQKL